MSVTRTFTVTVVSTGSGNKYFIDGVQQATVELAEGGIYKFDQSDSSNETHPLRFATAADAAGGTQYTTGVTASGTPGSSGAYTQISVAASAPTLYYYCTAHGGMGGQANTPTGDAYGMLTWNLGNWSAQNDFTVEVTGISASSSIGAQTIELNTIEPATGSVATMSAGQTSVELVNNGWGANTWGFSEWGQVGQILTGQQATLTVASVTPVIDVSFSVSGISLTSSIGSNSVTINQALTLTGQSLTSSIGNADPAPDAMVVGQSMTTSIGSVTAEGVIEVGWGGDSWGQNQWGELNAPSVPVTGASATITAGTGTTVAAQATVSVTGVESKINILGTNFQKYSQDLSQSVYTKRGNATATANYGIAPDGTKTSSLVDNIQGNNTSGGTYSDIYSSCSTNYTTSGQALEPSFFIKRVSGSSTELFFANPENAAQGQWKIDFNSLSTTEWTRIDKNHSAVTVQNTYTSSSSGGAGSHFRVDASSSVDLSFEVWGIQIEEGTVVSNYKATSNSQVDSILLAGTSHTQAVTGQQLTMNSESSVINIGVPVTGITATMTAGQSTIDPTFLVGEGWGRDAWGNLGWGVNYSAINSGGLELTSSIGNEAVTADANVTVSGMGMTSTFGVYSVQADADISLTVSEHTMTSSLGSISLTQTTNESVTGQSLTSSIGDGEAGLFLVVPVTGSQLTISQGNASLEQSTEEPVTGQSLTSSIGTATEIPAQIVGVSGIPMTITVGDEGTASNANVSPTGISLTASTGEVNITAWSEIDLGVTNVWTEVDLAA